MANATSRRSLFAAASAVALGSGVTAGAAATVADLAQFSPDAELLALGRQLAVEWVRMDEWDAANPHASDEAVRASLEPGHLLVDRIEHMEARTFEGLLVKAQAVSWCNSGEEIDEDRFSPYPAATTDARIAASIVRDLLRSA